MTPAELQARLAQSYDRARWLDTLGKTLPRTEIFAAPQPVPAETTRAESIVQLGKVHLAGQRNLALLEVTVGDRVDLLRNRVGLRQLVARYIDQAEYHGVLAIFHQRDAKDYRFTFAAREAVLDAGGQLVRHETAPRRYSYLLGPNESCRTAAERFALLAARGDRAEIKDIVEAFNVDKLNREFFADFRKAFALVVTDLLARNQGWARAEAEAESQTLLSRLLFLYFIQRKGWLNRRRDYLVANFRRHVAEDPEGTSFYDKFLKHFFVKLASEEAFFPNLDLGDLPFLNGGLFDDDMDALSGRSRIKIGNATFRQLFGDLLEAYNFTVREDTPLDQEVAIDPEMLGKIFESLVLQLEQTDADGETSRHDTGSYYTPRPLVHHLCREGLRVWLEQFPPSPARAADWPKQLQTLLALDASDGLDETERATLDSLLMPEEARSLLNRLNTFRACDLAVGSGALLVGLLHELLNLHRLCETRARGKDPADADADWLYENKKRIIENVLYGVDLQQRAVEICKLRLWISLMVDYPLEVDPDNCALPDFRKALKKIAPLPNLDFKIRRANSLIEYIRGHAVNFPQAAADSRDFAFSLNKLASAKHRFYEARRKKEKRAARLDILEAIAELARYEFSAAKLKYGFLPTEKDAERVAELAHAEKEMGQLAARVAAARKKGERQKDDDLERLSRVFNDEANPTFVWQLDFAEIFHRSPRSSQRRDSLLPEESPKPATGNSQPSGFDLVLANPPYVRQEKFKDQKPLLQNAYECYTGIADLYVYFYERGVRLLGQGGVLSFISSNKFFRAAYGEKLRAFLRARTELQTVIDFGDLPIFEATAYPCIIVASNRAPKPAHEVRTLNVRTTEELARFAELASSSTAPRAQTSLSDAPWQLESPLILRLLEKLRGAGRPLREYVGSRVYRGITTGFNQAFVVDRATRDRLIADAKSSAVVLKPYLRGRDVKRWRAESQSQWLIFTRKGSSIETLPAIEKHLSQFKEHLLPGAPGGRKPGTYQWFEIQDNIAYWREFTKPKIVSTKISIRPTFAFDETGHYLGNTSYFFPATSDGLYLLGLLNSALFHIYAKKTFVEKQGGWYEIQPDGLESFPIPTASAADRASIEKLAEKCLAAHGENCQAWESEINDRVYRLYGLDKDEIQMVEESTK
jgi:hypothetical protein